MKMIGVKSSNVLSVGHDGENMGVVFKGGAEYRYAGVPREVFDKVLGAESVGSTLAKLVTKKYTATKIEKDKK